MDTVAKKKSRLPLLFIVSLVVFNLLFFFKDPLIRVAYRALNVYSKCPSDTLNCDVGSYTVVDDIILGIFALSFFAIAVIGAMLLSRKIEQSWRHRSEQKKPRPRQPNLRQ